ncbi:MAG: PQQ-binding-like beta-propeller repeat protein [Candidatus Micrarchaeia archaeon]|jgi:hypothetical protein
MTVQEKDAEINRTFENPNLSDADKIRIVFDIASRPETTEQELAEEAAYQRSVRKAKRATVTGGLAVLALAAVGSALLYLNRPPAPEAPPAPPPAPAAPDYRYIPPAPQKVVPPPPQPEYAPPPSEPAYTPPQETYIPPAAEPVPENSKIETVTLTGSTVTGRSSGERKWNVDIGGTVYSPPYSDFPIIDGYVYAVNTGGEMFKIRAEDGNVMWHRSHSIQFFDQPELRNGTVYVSGHLEDGSLHGYTVKTSNGDLIQFGS